MQKSIEMIFKYVKNNSSLLFCILLLVIYFFLYFHTIPVIGLCLFLCSLFLGVHIISKRSGNFLINNPELFLLVCMFLYGFYNPLVAYFSDKMDNDVYKAMIIYATAVPAYLIGLYCYKLTEIKKPNNKSAIHAPAIPLAFETCWVSLEMCIQPGSNGV